MAQINEMNYGTVIKERTKFNGDFEAREVYRLKEACFSRSGVLTMESFSFMVPAFHLYSAFVVSLTSAVESLVGF